MNKKDNEDQNSNEQLVSELNESEKRVYRLTYYNPITNLPNRRKLREVFYENIFKNEGVERAILSVDIDRFHSINELYGREIGDKLLRVMADRLRTIFDCENCVFHDGEDNFFIFSDHTSPEELEALGNKILNVLSRHFIIDGKSLYVTVSIGMSHYPTTGTSIKALLNQAEIAMFKVKNKLGNSYKIFIPKDAKDIERRTRIELDLQNASDNKELYLCFQPKVQLTTGKVISVEALMRWEHPELGRISPGEFIPVAEETGIIVDIGYWVIYEAIKQTKKWHDKGYKITIAINVSAIQFHECNFVEKVLDILNSFDIDPSYLAIEITESVFKNFRHTDSVIAQFKEKGVRMAIDDFGTGYSSLSVLRYVFIDTVKIDKSFIDDVPYDHISSILVSSMIRMGQDMAFDIIAEGVETCEQANFLIQQGCQYGQGYLYSKPVSAEELTQYIDEKGIKKITDV